MGAFLDKPKTDKEVSKGSGNGLRYGVSSMQGWRIEMEDAHCAVVGLPGLDDWSFFAVFDGHAGHRVSAYCSKNLLESIIQVEEFTKHATENEAEQIEQAERIQKVKDAIRSAFLQLDEKMKGLPEVVSGEDKSGSTAVCALISPTHFYLANCGDSRLVLSRKGQAVVATLDHKPVNPVEKDRIQKAGGSVMIQRVNGSLAVSRALGDFEYKQVEGKGPCEQLVSPEPEILAVDRNIPEDEFLILACDGVWDVMTNEDLCDFIRHQLTLTDDVELICSSIIDVCLHKGSKDNMSVVLVVFPGAPKVSPEAQQKDSQLDATIEKRVAEILKNNPDVTINGLFQSLSIEEISGLPPGAGIEAKRGVVEKIYNRLSNGVDEVPDDL